MKALFLSASMAVLGLAACSKKDCPDVTPDASATNVPDLANIAKGGSGGGGNGGGSGNTTTGPIQNFLSSTASRLVATKTDSLFVSFTQPAPAGGYTLAVSSSDGSMIFPATVSAPAGAYNAYIPVSSPAISAAKNVTFTVSLGGQSKSSTIRVFPLHATFPAPSLQSPGNGSQHNYHIQIIFQWAANANAYYSHLQISPNANFSVLNYDNYVAGNQFPADYFDGTGLRYWRVRYVDGSDSGGPWSAARTFTVKPQ